VAHRKDTPEGTVYSQQSRWLGMLLALAGAVGLGYTVYQRAWEPPAEVNWFFLSGIMFLAGVFLLLRRDEILINARDRRYRRVKRRFIRTEVREGDFSDIAGLELRAEMRSAGNTSYTAWVVSLLWRSDERFEMGAWAKPAPAYAKLEALSRELGLPVIDTTTPEVEVMRPEEAGLPLKERLSGKGVDFPKPPGGCRISMEVRENRVVFTLPPLARRSVAFVLILVGVTAISLMAVCFLLVFLRDGSPTERFALVAAGIALMVVGDVATITGIGFLNARIRIAANPEELTRAYFFLGKELLKKSVRASEIKDIKLHAPEKTGQEFIGIRTDSDLITISAPLTREESEWLVKAITAVVGA